LIDEKEKQNKINLFKINAEKKATKKLNEI
jgi:hypothetical protein